MSGFDWSSSTTYSTLRPRSPPLRLRRSTKISLAIWWARPVCAKGPVSDRVWPIRIGGPDCACAAAGESAAKAQTASAQAIPPAKPDLIATCPSSPTVPLLPLDRRSGCDQLDAWRRFVFGEHRHPTPFLHLADLLLVVI